MPSQFEPMKTDAQAHGTARDGQGATEGLAGSAEREEVRRFRTHDLDVLLSEGLMRELVEKIRKLEEQIAKQKGHFSLFALFLREEAPNRWDLVVSAPWFWADEKKTLDFLAKKLRSRLANDELVAISRIVLIEQSNPELKAIHRTLQVEHGAEELRDSNFFGLQIRHAYVITSHLPSRAEASRTGGAP